MTRKLIVGTRDRSSFDFYRRLVDGSFEPNRHIDVLPKQRLLYVCVPKCASSRIKMTLSKLLGRSPKSVREVNKRKLSGLKGPKHIGLTIFRKTAIDPGTLRFSFVRNPYDRLVSCWTDKFRDTPLVSTYPTVDSYLAWRRENDRSLPEGIDHTLSFDQFITFATATAPDRVNAHWHLQDKLLDVPGIELDLIGKVESFAADFSRVLDHVEADDTLRFQATRPINISRHERQSDYYTPELADRVYRAYESDFDRFEYARALS